MLLQFVDLLLRQACDWWSLVGSDGRYYIWLASGGLGLLMWSWISYQVIRRLLGHIKVNGVWFRPGELDLLLDRLDVIEKSGIVLSVRDVNLLDRYRPDRRQHLKRLGDVDFVSW